MSYLSLQRYINKYRMSPELSPVSFEQRRVEVLKCIKMFFDVV